ncbi:MAG: hypothetical protein Greene101449_1182 [Candidatus Peregrinibacteria bacterium Greene1014_49]|nr:MAG: hypothetical protein Greene101449_1182 [Candidatus Peregrinibacteria bacterium Greene1014_49]
MAFLWHDAKHRICDSAVFQLDIGLVEDGEEIGGGEWGDREIVRSGLRRRLGLH